MKLLAQLIVIGVIIGFISLLIISMGWGEFLILTGIVIIAFALMWAVWFLSSGGENIFKRFFEWIIK